MKVLVVLLELAFLADGLLAAEVCYPPCGCFTDDPPHDRRPLPESPEEQEIRWTLFTRINPTTGTDISLTDTIVPPDFDINKPTKFLIHGWSSNPDDGNVTQLELKDAFLERFDYNVIVVDWSTGAAKPLYIYAMVNTRVVGACSGQLALQMGSPGSVLHCTGHSLGGHTCGYMGEYLEGTMARVTGLDPAGPGFGYDNDTRLRLDSTDAVFVDVMHTNIDAIFELGLGEAMGHVDFYPNKGARQPGCATPSCSHSIVKNFYLSSIEVETCTFLSYPCASNEDADAGLCATCDEQTTCQHMGYFSNTQPGRGTFFLETDPEYPYCQN